MLQTSNAYYFKRYVLLAWSQSVGIGVEGSYVRKHHMSLFSSDSDTDICCGLEWGGGWGESFAVGTRTLVFLLSIDIVNCH